MFDEANFDSLIDDHDFDHVLQSPKISISPRSFSIGPLTNTYSGNINGHNGVGSKRSGTDVDTSPSSDILNKRNRPTDLHVNIASAGKHLIYYTSFCSTNCVFSTF